MRSAPRSASACRASTSRISTEIRTCRCARGARKSCDHDQRRHRADQRQDFRSGRSRRRRSCRRRRPLAVLAPSRMTSTPAARSADGDPSTGPSAPRRERRRSSAAPWRRRRARAPAGNAQGRRIKRLHCDQPLISASAAVLRRRRAPADNCRSAPSPRPPTCRAPARIDAEHDGQHHERRQDGASRATEIQDRCRARLVQLAEDHLR